MAANSPATSRPRIALYGHDTQGLGHLRRNLHLAAGMAADLPGGLGADVVLLSGAAEVGLFERPRGVEVIVVPGVRKDSRGTYRPYRLRGHGLGDVVDLRSSTIAGALTHFAPDVFVVDKAPWGFAGELTEILESLKESGTRLVFGLRDVLDAPSVAAAEWRRDRGDEAVRRLYDEVWVYGDRRVHDLPGAAGMAPDVRAKAHHIGYVCGTDLNAPMEPGAAEPAPLLPDHRPPLPEGARGYVLVTVGGGQDGLDLARAAVRMRLPEGITLVLLTGPQMSTAGVAEVMGQAQPSTVVMPFSPHASRWLADAHAAITMGGANTVTEILSTTTPALVVPRVRPRQEQAVRAEALAAWGMLDVLPPSRLSGGVLSRWVERVVEGRVDRSDIDLGGVRGARDRAERLIARPRSPLRLVRDGHDSSEAVVPQPAGSSPTSDPLSTNVTTISTQRSRHAALSS